MEQSCFSRIKRINTLFNSQSFRIRIISLPAEMKRYRGSIRRSRYLGTNEIVLPTGATEKIRGVGLFRLEPSSDSINDPCGSTNSPVIVENPQEETRWYWKYFLGNDHQNFAGIDPSTKLPFFMSTMLEEEKDMNRVCRAILWTSQGPRRLCIPTHNGSSKVLTAKCILQKFPGMGDFNRSLKEITDVKIQRELVILEDQEGGANCKFGVIYALDNQVSDTQMLSNEHGDEDFERFLKILGQRIELHNWGSYRGGLDVTTNSTGKESVYTVFSGYEIMFHVSTLLPYSNDNFQQIERKRHVGNDIVNIVFESGGDPEKISFQPTMMKSHFTHVFAVVKRESLNDCYRLWIFSEESLPAFGPAIPRPNIFHDSQMFREFLLTKLINAEKAAFKAKAFVEKRRKTLDCLIKDMYMEHMKESNKGIHKVTDIVIKKFKNPMRKETPKEIIDFCKYGELVKLEKILCGDISRSLEVTNICRKQPWEPILLYEDILSWNITGSDNWGPKSVVLITEDAGVVLISDGLSFSAIEANARVVQISIREDFGIFLARTDKGKDSYLSVFVLNDLRMVIQNRNAIEKKTIQDHRIPSSKGCHLFATSDTGGLRLNIVLCISKNLSLLRWVCGPLGKVQSGSEIVNNFTLLKVINTQEEATAISLYEQSKPVGQTRAVILTKSYLAIVDFASETVRPLNFDIPKSPVNSLYGNYNGDHDEIIISYQNITLSMECAGNNVQETFWSSSLQHFVYRFPFLVGFGCDLIEVRLAINGNLLFSKYMPAVKLISSKNDIIFAADRLTDLRQRDSSTSLTTSESEKKWNRSSMHKKESKEKFFNKRWNLYHISALALQMEERDANTNVYDQPCRNVRNRSERRPLGRKDKKYVNASTDIINHDHVHIDLSVPNSPVTKVAI